jgi:hypothetical protein
VLLQRLVAHQRAAAEGTDRGSDARKTTADASAVSRIGRVLIDVPRTVLDPGSL